MAELMGPGVRTANPGKLSVKTIPHLRKFFGVFPGACVF